MEHFSEIDPHAYLWKRSKDVNHTLWRRRALGPESPWILKPKKYRQIFVAGDLMLSSSITYSELTTAVQTAWKSLRLAVPDVAVCAAIDDTATYLQYEPPKDETDIETWLRRTTLIDSGSRRLEMKELRLKMVVHKAGQDSDSSFLLAHSKNELNNSHVTSCQILLNVDHRITDGIGARIIFGTYLSLLALSVAEPGNLTWDKDAWERSTVRLSPPWVAVMDSKQVICGPEYQRSVAECQSNLENLVRVSQIQFSLQSYYEI
jgi:hypothetical protein